MTRHKLSADILALNPELAATQAKSRALTPGGRGNGFSDDAQTYREREDYKPADPRQRLWEETKLYLIMLDRWDDGSRAAMIARQACENLMQRLERGES